MAETTEELCSTTLCQTTRLRVRHETALESQGRGQSRGHNQERIGDGSALIAGRDVLLERIGNLQHEIETVDRLSAPCTCQCCQKWKVLIAAQRQTQVVQWTIGIGTWKTDNLLIVCLTIAFVTFWIGAFSH